MKLKYFCFHRLCSSNSSIEKKTIIEFELFKGIIHHFVKDGVVQINI